MERPGRVFGVLRALTGARAPAPPSSAPTDEGGSDIDGELMRQLMMRKRSIDTTIVDPAMSRRFMDRVIAQWQALGEAEP